MENTVLVLNGSPPSEGLLQWRASEADNIVAVDGGWHALRNAEVMPDIVVGDFDSFPDLERVSSEFPNLQFEYSGDQETTDFQKAIEWTEENTNTSKLIILGGLGKRSDHFLSNLMTSIRINLSCEVIFDDDREWIERVTPSTPLNFSGRSGSTVSILALELSSGICSSGLKWNLQDHEFSPQSKFSQSNLCVSDQVEVTCATGSLFAIISKGIG